MKDSEFIELLNLYLDHEISEADAARLEAEVQTNLARRRLYRDYCRMQKACKALAFETESVAVSSSKVVPFNPAAARTSRTAAFYTIGGFAAAAACLAIIFVGSGREGTVASTPEANLQPAVAHVAPASQVAAADVTLVAAETAPVQPAPRYDRPPTTLVADPLLLTVNARADGTLTTPVQQANDQFEWIAALQVPPLQQHTAFDPLRFDTVPVPLRPEGGRALGNRSRLTSPIAPAEEMIMLEFRK
jgi:hypothetical protein